MNSATSLSGAPLWQIPQYAMQHEKQISSVPFHSMQPECVSPLGIISILSLAKMNACCVLTSSCALRLSCSSRHFRASMMATLASNSMGKCYAPVLSSGTPLSLRSSCSIRINLLMVPPSRSFSTSRTASSSSIPSAMCSLILSHITFLREYQVLPRGSGRHLEPQVESSSSTAGCPSMPSRYSFQTSSTVPTVL